MHFDPCGSASDQRPLRGVLQERRRGKEEATDPKGAFDQTRLSAGLPMRHNATAFVPFLFSGFSPAAPPTRTTRTT